MKLTQSEEELMNHLWQKERAFMKDLIECYSDPKPAATTVATLLKRMQEKEFVGYEQLGRSRRYYPLVKKSRYFSDKIRGMISQFFDDSPAQFASFFTTQAELSDKELEELCRLVINELKKRKL